MRPVSWGLLGLPGLLLPLASSKHVSGLSFDRIITIWLENQDHDKVTVDPYIGRLKKRGITLTNFYGLTHPSQPNYLGAIGGDYWGLDHDGVVTVPSNVSTVVDLLDWKAINWGGYFEGLPSPGYLGKASVGVGMDSWDYVRKHNPFASYDSISHNGTRLLKLQSFEEFYHLFDTDPTSLPQVVWMSPNMLNDGHNTSLEYAAEWAHDFLTPLLRNDAFEGQRTLIMLTYDESEDYDRPNHITTLLLGNMIPRNMRGTEDPTYYTHYSFLSTIEYNWGLPCLGRYDVGANVFDVVSYLQGAYENKEPPNAREWDNSVSYYGPLNSYPKRRKPWPAPNKNLTGAGGEEVLRKIKLVWKLDHSDVPYDGSGNIYDGTRPPVYRPAVSNVEDEGR